VRGASGEKWANINAALFQGQRGLPGGSSLAQLLAEKRSVRNRMALPDLTISQILQWADAHHERTGVWPKQKTGTVQGTLEEKWINIDQALSKGLRGLPKGSSLAQLLAKERSVRYAKSLNALTSEQILQWADAHQKQTGEWPNANSGDVTAAPGEKWVNIDTALRQGRRGLAIGSSLAQLLAEQRGVRNRADLRDLTIEQILKWADVHRSKTGAWPRSNSGAVSDAPGEDWAIVDGSLSKGRRGLPGGSSLAQLLAEKRGIRNKKALPKLNLDQIRQWAAAHHQRTGEWPVRGSGKVLSALDEKWVNLDTALRQGRRGLPGGSSLAKLLRQERG
jgi:ribosomal protein S13